MGEDSTGARMEGRDPFGGLTTVKGLNQGEDLRWWLERTTAGGLMSTVLQ
jgi:hypothetical protein